MPSRFIPITPNADTSQQVSIINKNFAELDNEGTIKLYSDKSGTPNISIGIQSDGTSRIKVAKSGIDVTKANDSQLSFNSAQNTLKVVASGLFDLTHTFAVRTGPLDNTSDSSIFLINHNLGYTPVCLVYYASPDVSGNASIYFPFCHGTSFNISLGANYSVIYKAEVAATPTTINLGLVRSFWLANGFATGNFLPGATRYRVVLLQESAE